MSAFHRGPWMCGCSDCLRHPSRSPPRPRESHPLCRLLLLPPGPGIPEGLPWHCCLCWRGDLVQEWHVDLPPGRSGHQLADTNVVDSKWRLLTSSTVLYSLGLQHRFRLLTPWAKRYWLSEEEGGGPTFPYSATSSDRQALTIHRH